MLPDLTGFELLGTEFKNEQECNKWQKKEVIGDKVTFISVRIHLILMLIQNLDPVSDRSYTYSN